MALLLSATVASAQETKLPAPSKTGGKTIVETLWERKSDRVYTGKELTPQVLGDLLWAANGVNRPESDHHTNPTASNKQEISVYAFTKDAVCLYEQASHSLKQVASGDHRGLIAGGQQFAATAPVSIVIVMDLAKYGGITDGSRMMGSVDAGIVTENINLFCAGNGLKTVTRATMDVKAIKSLLGLGDTQIPILNNPVGY